MTTLQTLRYLVFGVLCALAPALLQAQLGTLDAR